MNWIAITISAYLFGALAVLADKFLLGSKRIACSQTYAFYVGLFGIGALIFAPLGFFFPQLRLSVPGGNQIMLSLISGFFYMVAIAFLYEAIKRAEASRVTPVVFSVVPIATFIISMFLNLEKLNSTQFVGMAFLVFGGLLISFDLPLRLGKKKFFAGFYLACCSGLFFAIAYVMFKFVYNEQLFFNGFIWTRFGMFVGALSLLLVPKWRKAIFGSLSHAKKPKKQHLHTGGIFIGNKIMGGASSIMLNYAISVGSATLVNSMVSLQYVFVLALLAIFSRKYPKIFEEKLLFWDWMQKFGAILIIALGMVLISK